MKQCPQNALQRKGRASRERQKSVQRCFGGLQAYRPVRAKRREVEQRMAWVAMVWASIHSALWVGVLGWWRPMVLHNHPAKSTSSTSARLMNVWPCKWTARLITSSADSDVNSERYDFICNMSWFDSHHKFCNAWTCTLHHDVAVINLQALQDWLGG